MFFKKKAPVADPAVPEAPAAEKPAEWGERDRAIVAGYVLKAFKAWNTNRPEHAIPESELTHFLIGLRMTAGTTPENAYQAFKDYSERKEGI